MQTKYGFIVILLSIIINFCPTKKRNTENYERYSNGTLNNSNWQISDCRPSRLAGELLEMFAGVKSKIYAEVNRNKPTEYWDYENSVENWGNIENYEIVKNVGRGKYSDVFEGFEIKTNKRVIIKVLKPVKRKKIKREIKILHNLLGGPNIIELYDAVVDPKTSTPSLIFEHVDNYPKIYQNFKDIEIKTYIFELLKALDFAHSMGIIHRDVKPHNVVVNPKSGIIRLIDWGLADFYHPGTAYNVRVASRYFKGPELLVDYHYYDYSLDIWSLGCILAGMIFKKDPFFRGRDNEDQLVRITRVLGTAEFDKYIEKYNINLSINYNKLIRNHNKISFDKFMTKKNSHLVSVEVIDLLEKMLKYDHMQRITAKEAMCHPYFDEIKNNSDGK